VENCFVPPSQEPLASLVATRAASRLWARDLSVFPVSQDSAARQSIEHRLGWLDAPGGMVLYLPEIEALAASVRRDGLTHICLLGMGGSSLCAEVLRLTLAPSGVRDRLLVLDTTDELAVRTASSTLDPNRTLFIVASKSGSTVEVSALESYFRAWVTRAAGRRAGEHFIAITDPDTSLVAHASKHGYRHTFINPADIGGRYSALSLFGLVSAALMEIPPGQLLTRAIEMTGACRRDDETNPGLALGAFMAAHAQAGRDKLTLLLPPPMSALGLWVEQLVAESTGKLGRGVLPVVDEPAGDPGQYGSDRAFVLVSTPGDAFAAARLAALTAAGHPVFHIEASPEDLGAEFFRWEFATAIAGAVLNVNPFDEPNVRDAKARTMAILEGPRPLSVSPPLSESEGFSVRTHKPGDAPVPGTGTYVALLDYLPVDDARAATVERIRTEIRSRTGAATTHGLGPRYLHSTGQYHKGGTNNGVFILLTADDATETAVPEASYSFSTLKHAQALGDFAALSAAGRHVVHVHITGKNAEHSIRMADAVNWAMKQLLQNREPLS
jgi:transaldolase/glucose-6-phosphate isomerase